MCNVAFEQYCIMYSCRLPQHKAHNREGNRVTAVKYAVCIYSFIYKFVYLYVRIYFSRQQSTEFTKVYFKNGNKNLVICIVDIVQYTTGSGYRVPVQISPIAMAQLGVAIPRIESLGTGGYLRLLMANRRCVYLFAMSGMLCVVYTLQYKVVTLLQLVVSVLFIIHYISVAPLITV